METKCLLKMQHYNKMEQIKLRYLYFHSKRHLYVFITKLEMPLFTYSLGKISSIGLKLTRRLKTLQC